MTHVLALVLGLFLLVFANQPLWLGDVAKGIWRKMEILMSRYPVFQNPWGVFLVGVLWSFIPCSLLYSVLMVAALSASALNGALIMLSFSLGGALFMALGSQMLIHLNTPKTDAFAPIAAQTSSLVTFSVKDGLPKNQASIWPQKTPDLAAWGIRLTGLALAANSAWILYSDLILNQAPWCLSTT
jgi:hypothetical protein